MTIIVLIVHTLSFIALSTAGILYTQSLKKALAEQIGLGMRRNLIIGDFRQAISDASVQGLPQFIALGYFRDGGVVFTLPTNQSPVWHRSHNGLDVIRYGEILVPIFLDDTRGYLSGELHFVFRRLESFPVILALWFVVSMGLFYFFRQSKQNLQKLRQQELERAAALSLGKLAAQVAHDIRSPLAALDAVLKNTAQLPENQRIMVRHAVNRIRDIANNLLEKNRQQSKDILPAGSSPTETPGSADEAMEVRLLSSTVDPVVTEKRLQFESKPGIIVDFELTQESYGLFAMIQPVEFRRIVSNLVNNAVEVLGDKGAVNIGLTHDDDNIILTVTDNGKGIPPDVLAKLGQRGETHGKTGGSGLGLFHARTKAESWGGSLELKSELGKGTTVTIKLPKAEAPSEFVPVLELVVGRPVVVLDDDLTIHQVWQGRFDSARVKEHDIEVIHFSEPGKLREWVTQFPEKANRALYLFDYELLNYKETGLSLAREFNLSSQVILVTSRYEERGVIEESARLGIRMIPKGLAGFVPIEIKLSSSRDKVAVLIDDDALVHMTWKVAARSAGVKLMTYKTPEDFYAGILTLPKDTPVYIDSDLGNNQKGEDIAKSLYEKGFIDITMATGYGPENFAHLPWLQVRGKEPPWG